MSTPVRILHEAERRLDGSSHLFRRSIHCDYEGGTLYVNGSVPSFYLKQTAQALLSDIEGVERVCNDVHVVNPWGVSSEPSGSAS
ncbi:MAG: BON domain-containing protein [Planctomycetota bacterium]